MTSKLTLYKNCDILIDKNIKVDEIDPYLATLSHLEVDNLNFIVPKREIKVKLELSQENVNIGQYKDNYNYAKLFNSSIIYYYFITNIEWTSVSVVMLTLYMDTISSFNFKLQGETQASYDYIITPKTLIHREHKDRWEYDDDNTLMPLTPLIDKVNEGINPLLYKDMDIDIEESKLLLKQKWYIIYMNENQIVETDYNQVNPVKILIAPEKTTRLGENAQIALTPSMVEAGYTKISTFIQDDKNEAIEVDIAGTTYILEGYFGFYGVFSGTEYLWLKIYKANASDNVFRVDIMKTIVDSSGHDVNTRSISHVDNLSSIDLFNPPSKLRAYYSQYDLTNFAYSYNKTYSPLYQYNNAFGIDSLDRTDSKIIKVIELPYCPIDVDYDLSSDKQLIFKKNITIDNDTKFIALVNNRYGFPQKRGAFKHSISIRDNAFPTKMTEAIDDCKNRYFFSDNPKDIELESKLYSSEFYQCKVVYDSFNMNIAYEHIDIYDALFKYYDNVNQDIILSMFTPTTIVSKFGFNINLLPDDEVEDYPLFLSIARNNELPIYSSQYINYIRNGFNYDVKAKNQQAMSSGIGVGLATLGAVAGIGLGIASNNPAVLAGSVISAITAVTSATTSAINSAITNQRAIEQKLAQAKAQAVSIQGNDDIDLLDVYTNDNKAKICHYMPSQEMTNNIFDLFYYTGYSVERLGLPDCTSRMRFNYVSADIDMLMVRHLPKDIVDDIKARWSLGITFMHRVPASLSHTMYDFNQELENWEIRLEDALTISS